MKYMLKFILLIVILSLFFKSREALNMKHISYLDNLEDPNSKKLVQSLQEEYIAKLVDLL